MMPYLNYDFLFCCETEKKDKALTSGNSQYDWNKPFPVLFEDMSRDSCKAINVTSAPRSWKENRHEA